MGARGMCDTPEASYYPAHELWTSCGFSNRWASAEHKRSLFDSLKGLEVFSDQVELYWGFREPGRPLLVKQFITFFNSFIEAGFLSSLCPHLMTVHKELVLFPETWSGCVCVFVAVRSCSGVSSGSQHCHLLIHVMDAHSFLQWDHIVVDDVDVLGGC